MKRLGLLAATMGLCNCTLANPEQITATLYIGRHFEVRDHNQPTKYVFNGSSRVAEVTGSLSANLRVQRLRLYPGWNLCSVAVGGPFPASGAEAISVAYQWNPGVYVYSQVALGQSLTAGTVLWLKARTNAVLSILGTYTDPASQGVQAGGDYLPGTGLEAWSPVLPRSTSAWTFDAQTVRWAEDLSGPLAAISDPLPFVSPGEAVYVQTAAAVSVAVPDPTLRIRYYHQNHLGSSSVITDAHGAMVEETAYHPFGTGRNTYEPRQVQEPYMFTQKERDRESGLQYFEARYLAGSLARFITADSKYLEPNRVSTNDLAALLTNPQHINLYGYVLNNPLRWIDQTGFSPGDPFKTAEKAAADALIDANPKSIAANREYGGLIYYDPLLKRYYATTPTTGTGDTFNPHAVRIPIGTKMIGDYHTHGDYTFMLQLAMFQPDAHGNLVQTTLNIPFHGTKAHDYYDSEHFSQQDLTGIAADATGIPGYKGYLGTPNGGFQQFDPSTGNVSPLSTARPEKDPTNCKWNYTGTFPYMQASCE